MSYFNLWLLMASAIMSPEGTFIDNSSKWHPVNTYQNSFLNRYYKLKQDVPAVTQGELKAKSSADHILLNEFAEQNNIPIIFDPFAKDEFGTLSLLDLNFQWLSKPLKTTSEFYSKQDEKYLQVNAFLFSDDYKIFTSYGHPFPIIKIQTKSGDCVCMTIADKARDKFKLTKKIKNIRKNLIPQRKPNYQGVVIPQLFYEDFVDISWINGLYCKTKHSKKYAINKAIEYLKLICDEEGCSVNAGVGLNIVPINTANKFSINKPFYFWLERPGARFPLLEAYIEQDALVQSESCN